MPQGGGGHGGHLQTYGHTLRQGSAGVPVNFQNLPDDCKLSILEAYDEALDSGQLGMDVLRPECDTEGDWAAVQCTGSDVCRWGDYVVSR